MSSARNPGRVAGFYYLLLCIVGPLRLIDFFPGLLAQSLCGCEIRM